MYGTDDNGTFPPATGNRTQNARVTIAGKAYRVMLPRIKDADPSTTPIAVGSLYDLFRKTRTDYSGNWGVQTYTALELGQPAYTENAGYNFTSTTYSSNQQNRLMFQSANLTTISQIQHSSPANNLGWRPVLLEV